jgi:hypothetical protein
MKWRIPALMLFLVVYNSVLAQDQQDTPAPQIERETVIVHRGWPPFIFELIPKGDSIDGGDNLIIKITGGPKGFRGQMISANVERTERTGFQADDVNFDGYEDFSVVMNWGNHANEDRAYWAFAPSRLKFVQAPQYDGITSIDDEHKLLISYSRASGMEFIEQTYRVENNKPVIVKSVQVVRTEEAKDLISPDYKEMFVQITRIYVHGKLRRTFYCEPEG